MQVVADQKAAMQRIAKLAERIRRATAESENLSSEPFRFVGIKHLHDRLHQKQFGVIERALMPHFFNPSALTMQKYGERLKDEDVARWSSTSSAHGVMQDIRVTELNWYSKHSRLETHG
ncbi:hypothetical protein D3C86_1892500 [compost metagenome]